MNTYEQGLRQEARVIDALQKNFKTVRKSSPREDKFLDIDVWVDGLPLSIKSQPACLRTGNLAFELKVLDAVSGKLEPSWYYKGKARGYLFLVGEELFVINKDRLDSFVRKFGWDKIKTLSPKVREEQKLLGHRHLDSECGLLNLETLIRLRVAIKIARLGG
jgi:hypothetical protein